MSSPVVFADSTDICLLTDGWLEKYFQACDAYEDESGRPQFGVIDAECNTVCDCRTKEYAQLVAEALNAFTTQGHEVARQAWVDKQ